MSRSDNWEHFDADEPFRVPPDPRRPVPLRRITAMSIVLLLALLAAGCSEDGEGPTSIPGDESGSSPSSPEATQPPEAESPDTTDESEGVPTEAVVVIVFVIVLLAVLIGVLIGRNRSSSGDSDESANGQE